MQTTFMYMLVVIIELSNIFREGGFFLLRASQKNMMQKNLRYYMMIETDITKGFQKKKIYCFHTLVALPYFKMIYLYSKRNIKLVYWVSIFYVNTVHYFSYTIDMEFYGDTNTIYRRENRKIYNFFTLTMEYQK